MGPAEIVRYLNRHGAARISRLVLISSALPFMMKTLDNPQGIDASLFAERRKQWLQDMSRFLGENARSFVLPSTSPEMVSWLAGMGAQAALKALVELNHTITETDLRRTSRRSSCRPWSSMATRTNPRRSTSPESVPPK